MHGFDSLRLVNIMAVPIIIATLAAAASAVPALDHQNHKAYAVGYKYPGKLLLVLSEDTLKRDFKCRGPCVNIGSRGASSCNLDYSHKS